MKQEQKSVNKVVNNMLDPDKKTPKREVLKAYALVMSANFEAVAIFISSYYLSQYLKEHYDVSDVFRK